jgi:hypothetical protein
MEDVFGDALRDRGRGGGDYVEMGDVCEAHITMAFDEYFDTPPFGRKPTTVE